MGCKTGRREEDKGELNVRIFGIKTWGGIGEYETGNDRNGGRNGGVNG